jgi:predicted lipoprotein with Yx(FWY)xxD motif
MKSIYVMLPLAAWTCFTILSCSKSSSSTPSKPLLTVSANSTVGSTIIVDSSGRSVYNFVFDAQGKATCLSGCAVVWPHEYFKGLSQNDLGGGLSISDFGTVTNTDGSMQTTYKGHPLYIYSNDALTAGVWSVTGNNIENGAWFSGQPNFSVFVANNKLSGGADSAYLTTSTGGTLYTTTAATPDASLVAYKPASSTINVPASLPGSSFSVNGSGVLTYQGNILYTCTNDAARGDITGASISSVSLVLVP